MPGTLATLIDLAPTKPGFVIEPIYLHYGGEASASRSFPLVGEATANLEATIDAVLLGGFYTFEPTVLGAHYSVGAFLPYSWVTVEGNVTTGPVTGRRKDSESGFGDITLIPAMLAWKTGSWQFNTLLSVYAPTGEYDDDRLANPGLNYWTFDPAAGVSYNNAEIGFNAALHGGITLNTENPDTDYRSGSLVHIEASVQQLLPLGPGFVGLGAEGFYLQQVTGDSGSGANLGDFEGRTVGIGPVLTYLLPLGEDTLAPRRAGCRRSTPSAAWRVTSSGSSWSTNSEYRSTEETKAMQKGDAE